jgi:hypothetical protein
MTLVSILTVFILYIGYLNVCVVGAGAFASHDQLTLPVLLFQLGGFCAVLCM